MDLKHIDTEEWKRALPETGFELFHSPAALTTLERHVDGNLHLLAGYKGNRPVGLFPLVVSRKALGKAILSPPPGMGIPRLGPLLMPASPKRRKREKLNQKFTNVALEAVGADHPRSLVRTVCPPDYGDPRPFDWEGLNVETAFTYVLETDGKTSDELLSASSKSLRREIRDARDLDIDVSVEGIDAAKQVHEQTVARYEEQDREYALEWPYVRDLTKSMAGDDRCRIYVARSPDGEFLSGITALYSNNAAYFWQGGTRATYEGTSVNSLLHWRIVEDLVADPPRETVTKYDLMGANTQRLCRYKSKFGAELVPYYVAESAGTQMQLAKKAYQLVGR